MSSTNEILGGEEIEMQRFDFEQTELGRRQALKKKWTGMVEYLSSLNDRINRSTFGRVFRLKGSGHVRSRLP
jgi:AGZA family xanthine/uracil permease-like MFS transporter